MTLKIDLPNEDEMFGVIKEYIDDYRNEISIEWDNTDIREAAGAKNVPFPLRADLSAAKISKRLHPKLAKYLYS
jgi:hypothetical protein